ncbi:unnamed protein product, partial [Ixodes pacificus]
ARKGEGRKTDSWILLLDRLGRKSVVTANADRRGSERGRQTRKRAEERPRARRRPTTRPRKRRREVGATSSGHDGPRPKIMTEPGPRSDEGQSPPLTASGGSASGTSGTAASVPSAEERKRKLRRRASYGTEPSDRSALPASIGVGRPPSRAARRATRLAARPEGRRRRPRAGGSLPSGCGCTSPPGPDQKEAAPAACSWT